MRREVTVEDIEELHESSRDVFGQGNVGAEREGITHAPHELRTQWSREGLLGSRLTDPEEARSQWIEDCAVEFMKFSVRVDKDASLLGQLGFVVVADGIVCEIINDFQCEEEAWRVHVCVPVEDGTINDFDVVKVPTRIERVLQVLHLKTRQGRRNLNYLELGPLVHFVVCIADEIQDIQHHCPVSCSHLVYYQVMVRVERQLVVRH